MCKIFRKASVVILIVNINTIFASGIFSNLDSFSVYGSTSFSSYKESFVSESLELVDIRPSLTGFSVGAIYNSCYDFTFAYLDNSESINVYNFPYVDKYISTKFHYHINRYEKFKLKIGLDLIKSKEYEYTRNSFIIGLYKDIDYFNNPVIIFLDLISSNQECNNCQEESFSGLTIGGNVKLLVDKLDNNEIKDIIWFGLELNTNDFNKYYFGFNSGVFIPLK